MTACGPLQRLVLAHPCHASTPHQKKSKSRLRLRQEAYLDLAKKSLAFFSAVTRLFDADFIVKVDDDVYFRLQHMPHIVHQWKDLGAGTTSRDTSAALGSVAQCFAVVVCALNSDLLLLHAGYIGCMKTGGALRLMLSAQ